MSVDYSNHKEDSWYKWQGQKPPERIPHLTEEERAELMANNLNGHTCDWYQNGAFAICDQGNFEHGMRIKPGLILDKEKTDATGKPSFKDFGPILRKQQVSG